MFDKKILGQININLKDYRTWSG